MLSSSPFSYFLLHATHGLIIVLVKGLVQIVCATFLNCQSAGSLFVDAKTNILSMMNKCCNQHVPKERNIVINNFELEKY
ncbi:hypothetical protein P8452_01089 [Trifolium repens]|nr:hypothetical protein P8452_01089 [Trifolium repens]